MGRRLGVVVGMRARLTRRRGEREGFDLKLNRLRGPLTDQVITIGLQRVDGLGNSGGWPRDFGALDGLDGAEANFQPERRNAKAARCVQSPPAANFSNWPRWLRLNGMRVPSRSTTV